MAESPGAIRPSGPAGNVTWGKTEVTSDPLRRVVPPGGARPSAAEAAAAGPPNSAMKGQKGGGSGGSSLPSSSSSADGKDGQDQPQKRGQQDGKQGEYNQERRRSFTDAIDNIGKTFSMAIQGIAGKLEVNDSDSDDSDHRGRSRTGSGVYGTPYGIQAGSSTIGGPRRIAPQNLGTSATSADGSEAYPPTLERGSSGTGGGNSRAVGSIRERREKKTKLKEEYGAWEQFSTVSFRRELDMDVKRAQEFESQEHTGLERVWYETSSWIIPALVGFLTAATGSTIEIIVDKLFTWRRGICITDPFMTAAECCAHEVFADYSCKGHEPTGELRRWSEILFTDAGTTPTLDPRIYAANRAKKVSETAPILAHRKGGLYGETSSGAYDKPGDGPKGIDAFFLSETAPMNTGVPSLNGGFGKYAKQYPGAHPIFGHAHDEHSFFGMATNLVGTVTSTIAGGLGIDTVSSQDLNNQQESHALHAHITSNSTASHPSDHLASQPRDYVYRSAPEVYNHLRPFRDETSVFNFIVDASILLVTCMVLAITAALLVKHIAPHARGSGIPEVKTILGGFQMPSVLSATTLTIKGIGLCMTVGSDDQRD